MIERDRLHPTLAAGLKCWESKCRDDRLPGAEAIVPFELAPQLPFTFMLSRVDADLVLVWTGNAVKEQVGVTVKDRDMRQTPFVPEDEAALRSIFEDGRPHHAHGEYVNPNGVRWHYERIVLPLAADGRRVDGAFGALVSAPVS